jgi:hypothetical protein
LTATALPAGKEGSHYDPNCDLFQPSEKRMVLTSDAFMIGMLGVLAACTAKLGVAAMFNLYFMPCECEVHGAYVKLTTSDYRCICGWMACAESATVGRWHQQLHSMGCCCWTAGERSNLICYHSCSGSRYQPFTLLTMLLLLLLLLLLCRLGVCGVAGHRDLPAPPRP